MRNHFALIAIVLLSAIISPVLWGNDSPPVPLTAAAGGSPTPTAPIAEPAVKGKGDEDEFGQEPTSPENQLALDRIIKLDRSHYEKPIVVVGGPGFEAAAQALAKNHNEIVIARCLVIAEGEAERWREQFMEETRKAYEEGEKLRTQIDRLQGEIKAKTVEAETATACHSTQMARAGELAGQVRQLERTIADMKRDAAHGIKRR